MLDKDQIPEADIHACIDWATKDDFWSPNILSLPKLRAKYDQLRMAARRKPAGRQQETDALFDRAMQRAIAAETIEGKIA